MISDTDSYCSVSYAFAKLLKHIKPFMDTAVVPVFDSKGYVLKEDVVSDGDIPAYSSSHMDGFALRSGETISASESMPLSFKISGDKSMLGTLSPLLSKTGEVFRIQTGGYLPSQTDAVVPIESVKILDNETVIINS